jgi:hypothetical protein
MQRVSESEPRSIATTEAAAVAKLIAKLRWICLDREAERLSTLLAQTAPGQCRTIGPRDTD